VALGTLASKRRPGTKADRKTRRRGVLEHDRDLLKKRREMAIMDEGRRQLAGRMSRQKNLAAGEVAEHRRCRHVQDVGEQAVARGRAWQQKDERRRYVAEDLDGKRQRRPGRSPRGGWREGVGFVRRNAVPRRGSMDFVRRVSIQEEVHQEEKQQGREWRRCRGKEMS
jgi:hypothetical protein